MEGIRAITTEWESNMRFAALTALLLVLLAAPVLAQDGGIQVFKPEEGKRFGELQQQIQEAFSFKEHAKAIGLLSKSRDLLLAALGRVESGETEVGDKKEGVVAQLEAMLANNWYNSACCLSRTDRKDEAIEALGKSIELGFLDVDHMKLDADLDNIRKEPGYAKLLESLNYNEVVETYAPEGVAANAPLLVVLHGARENESEFLARWKALADARGLVLAAPRGPITVTRKQFDWKRYSDDKDAALKKIGFAIEKAKTSYSVDPARIYLLGAGSGGYFSTLYGLMHPDTVKGVVSLNAYWNKYYFEDFLAKAAEAGLPVCLIQGKDDPFLLKAKAGVEQMSAGGMKAKFLDFDGGKELPENIADVVKQALDWIKSA